MASEIVDALGLKCPQPILKVATKIRQMQPGDTLEILADCESFPNDIRAWATKTGNALLFCTDEGGGKYKAQVQL